MMIATAYMDNDRLRQLITETATKMIEDQPGFWKFEFDGALVFVMTDQSHNRMRIMTPVAEVSDISESGMLVLMRANFDRALDARYCVNEETLWSAFIHPLQQLGNQQFLDALGQVVTLARNYGTSFSSGNLLFGG